MAARPIRTFTVLPHLPERLQGLQKLAYNMAWCWNHDAISLFRRIDDDRFEAVENSPVKLLGAIDQMRLEQLLHDEGFLAHTDRVEEQLDRFGFRGDCGVTRFRAGQNAGRFGHDLSDRLQQMNFISEFRLAVR